MNSEYSWNDSEGGDTGDDVELTQGQQRFVGGLVSRDVVLLAVLIDIIVIILESVLGLTSSYGETVAGAAVGATIYPVTARKKATVKGEFAIAVLGALVLGITNLIVR